MAKCLLLSNNLTSEFEIHGELAKDLHKIPVRIIILIPAKKKHFLHFVHYVHS